MINLKPAKLKDNFSIFSQLANFKFTLFPLMLFPHLSFFPEAANVTVGN